MGTKTSERLATFSWLEDLACLGGCLQSQHHAKHLHLSAVLWMCAPGLQVSHDCRAGQPLGGSRLVPWSCSHLRDGPLEGFLSRKAKVGSGWTWGKLILLQAALPWCTRPGGRCGGAVDIPPWLVRVPLNCQTSHNTAMCFTHNPCLSSKNVQRGYFFYLAWRFVSPLPVLC